MMRKIKPLPSSSSPAGQAVRRSRCCRLLAGIKNARAFQESSSSSSCSKEPGNVVDRSPESCLFFFLPLPFADLVSPAAGGMLLLCIWGFSEEAQVVQKSTEANHSQRRPREALAANFVLLVVRSSGQARRHLHVGANPPVPCA